MIKIISLIALCTTLIQASVLISVGGFDVTKYKNQYSFRNKNTTKTNVNISEVLYKKSKHTNAVSMWITRDWKEDWYGIKTVQKEIINKGYTPVFIFYWFGDDVSVKFIKKNKRAYFHTLNKFLTYLKKLNGQKIVVLNPEYNMSGVSSWKGMNDIFLKSFQILRKDPQVLVGPCVGDFGNYKNINDEEEWKLFHPSLCKAAKKADFIAFQEMRALTKNSKEEILKTPKRSLAFAKYLYKTYKKPTMLAYLAISSYGKDGEKIQNAVYKGFIKVLPKMKEEGHLMLFGIFHYFDYPGHVGYFKEAEEFFGVLRKDGTKKPSFQYYNKLH